MGNDGMKRIQRVAGRFRRLFTVLVFCIPLLDILYWLSFNHLPQGLLAELPAAASRQLSPLTLALAFSVSLIPVSVAMFGMMTLRKLFALYEHAVMFSADNVKCFRRLGYTLIAWVIAGMLFTTLISIVITAGNPPGERLMAAQLGVSDVSGLIIGAIVVLISWVMDEGRKLEDEQAHTV